MNVPSGSYPPPPVAMSAYLFNLRARCGSAAALAVSASSLCSTPSSLARLCKQTMPSHCPLHVEWV
eukprot:1185341-Prorocentrum_minimum.AAC.7